VRAVPLIERGRRRRAARKTMRQKAQTMSFGSLVFTPTITRLQERHGSRRQYERMERSGSAPQTLGRSEIEFIGERDSFYWATTGETGWPYIQHRGGPKGFLKVIDDHTLALADFRGNKQYISTGNLLTTTASR